MKTLAAIAITMAATASFGAEYTYAHCTGRDGDGLKLTCGPIFESKNTGIVEMAKTGWRLVSVVDSAPYFHFYFEKTLPAETSPADAKKRP